MHTAHRLAGQHLVICPGNAGDTEVHHAQLAVIQQHDVLGLDIPVDNALFMGMLQCAQNLHRKMNGLFPAHLGLLIQVLLQSDPVNIFHNNNFCFFTICIF